MTSSHSKMPTPSRNRPTTGGSRTPLPTVEAHQFRHRPVCGRGEGRQHRDDGHRERRPHRVATRRERDEGQDQGQPARDERHHPPRYALRTGRSRGCHDRSGQRGEQHAADLGQRGSDRTAEHDTAGHVPHETPRGRRTSGSEPASHAGAQAQAPDGRRGCGHVVLAPDTTRVCQRTAPPAQPAVTPARAAAPPDVRAIAGARNSALLGTFSTPVVADASCPVRGPPELLVTKGGSPGRMEETGHPAYE